MCCRRRCVERIYKVVVVYSCAPTDSTVSLSNFRWEAVPNTVTSSAGRCRCIVDINGNLAVPSMALQQCEGHTDSERWGRYINLRHYACSQFNNFCSCNAASIRRVLLGFYCVTPRSIMALQSHKLWCIMNLSFVTWICSSLLCEQPVACSQFWLTLLLRLSSLCDGCA